MSDILIEDVLGFISEMHAAIADDDESYFSMHVFFSGKQKYFADREEIYLAEAAAVLANITHMALDAESKNAPIVAALKLQDGRSICPDDLQPNQRTFLGMLYPSLGTGLLKSRIAEITLMLETPRRWDLVDEILEGYLAEALSEKTWHTRQQRHWTRAVSLSRQYRKESTVRRIEEQILHYLDTHPPGNPGISLPLYRFINEQQLLETRLEESAAGLMAFAEYEKAGKDFSLAERLFSLATEFYKRQQNLSELRRAQFESAECLYLEAENRAQLSEQGNLLASGLYERALQRYRLIPAAHRGANGAAVRIEQCLRKVREHGELSLDDMHSFRLPTSDLSDMIDLSINHVRDKGHIFKASLYFAGFNTITAESVQQDDEQKQFRISDLFGTVFISGDGRAIGRTRSAGSDRAHIRQMQSFDFSLKFTVAGEILPAMNQLLQEYNFVIQFFEELCHFSPLIPDDRVRLTARGLYLGFEYRFSESIHLLSPQVEYMVRNLLRQANVRTSVIDEGGLENEVGLSSLLDKPEAKCLLGEDLHFNLKSLFTDSLGANIRNYVAHGLLNDNSSRSDAVVYAWWLYLKIIVMSVTQAPLFRIPHPE